MAPYPDWGQSDTALTSIARLLRGLHDAARGFDPQGLTWDDALADPAGGTLVRQQAPVLSEQIRQFWRGERRFAAVGWGRSLLVLGFLDGHDAESRATISWRARKVAGRVEGGRPCTSPSCGAIR